MSDNQQQGLVYTYRASLMNRLYPLVKLAWVFIVAIGLFLYQSPISGAVMFVSVLLLAMIAGRIPVRQILGSSKIILMLGILLMVFHFFADPGEPLFKLGPLTITDNGLYQGPIFFFRLSVVVLASFVLIWTTDTRDLMVSLTKAGVPYRGAFAVFLALRFLPLIQREVDAVRAAHSIRGKSSSSGLTHRFKLWQRYIFTILINGLRKAETTATSLECRAFGLYPTRTYVKNVHFHPWDLLLIVGTVVLSTGLILAERAI
ncbi:MAG: energy-coupling factor transporter transmembrane component T [Anaerolineaceae bacterium]|nr:energy-coupling factor transporter transmembrane component T [Anaerolineaceae bacterium]